MGIFIEPPNIISSDVRAFFTTKIHTGKDKQIDKVLSETFNVSEDVLYLPMQKHTNKIHVLESENKRVIADAVVTARTNVFIGILVADCVPILLCDKKEKVIGAVHAGWRGTAQGILKSTIETMRERFRSMPEDIAIAIGPSIRQCSYAVGRDVKNEVQKATGDEWHYVQKGDKYFIDLSSANTIQALKMGIPGENIWLSDECTFCNPGRFHSYRYAQDCAGRQGGFIGMW